MLLPSSLYPQGPVRRPHELFPNYAENRRYRITLGEPPLVRNRLPVEQ